MSAPKLDPQHISLLESRFTMAGEEGKVAASIRAKLTERFKPEHLAPLYKFAFSVLISVRTLGTRS